MCISCHLKANIFNVIQSFDQHISGPPTEILHTIDLDKMEKNQENNNQKGSEMCMEGEEGKLVEKEEKETGVVKLTVYSAYWKAVGICLSPIILLVLFLMQGNPGA